MSSNEDSSANLLVLFDNRQLQHVKITIDNSTSPASVTTSATVFNYILNSVNNDMMHSAL